MTDLLREVQMSALYHVILKDKELSAALPSNALDTGIGAVAVPLQYQIIWKEGQRVDEKRAREAGEGLRVTLKEAMPDCEVYEVKLQTLAGVETINERLYLKG